MSGLVHEWMMVCLTEAPSAYEQFIFFTVHGLITVCQVLVEKSAKKIFGWNPVSKVPSVICIPTTWIIFLMTSSFFAGPWIRGDILNNARLLTIDEVIFTLEKLIKARS